MELAYNPRLAPDSKLSGAVSIATHRAVDIS